MTIKTDIEKLLGKWRGTGRLPTAPAREALPEAKASAYPQFEKTMSVIESPITEVKEEITPGSGTYEPSRIYVQDGASDKIFLLTSTDGLYTFEHKLLQQIDMEDANGAAISFIYQEVDPDTGAAYDD